MNKCIFSGRLTREPELRRTNDQTAVMTVDIAVDDGYKEKKRTYYPTLVLWRHNAEFIAKYAHKGDLLEVCARFTERKWEDKEGNKRTSTEFIVDEVSIISSKRKDAREDDLGYYEGTCDFAEEAENTDLPF